MKKLIGKGMYAKVFQEIGVDGSNCATKYIERDDNKAIDDYKCEAFVFDLSRRLCLEEFFTVAPKLESWEYSTALPNTSQTKCRFQMELYDITLEDFLQKSIPSESEIARILFHVFIRILVLEQNGIHHNDLFLRNIMIRNTESAKNTPDKVTEYILSPTCHFTIEDTNLDVALIDFGLSSGDGLVLDQKKKKKQFGKETVSTLMKSPEDEIRISSIMNTHPLELKLSLSQLKLVDYMCMFTSIYHIDKRLHALGNYKMFQSWMKYYKQILDREIKMERSGDSTISKDSLVIELFSHSFFTQLQLQNVIPNAIINISTMK